MNTKKTLKNELLVLTNNSNSKLLNLSDDVLLHILQCLDTIALVNISQVCRKFYHLSHDNTLKQYIDIRLKPLCLQDLWKVLHRKLTSAATNIHLKGQPQRKTQIMEKVTVAFMNQLCTKCPNISHFSLETFDLRELPLQTFPSNLKHLSLRSSMLTMGWFDCLKDSIGQDIKYLDLHSCSKISNSDLESLAYLRNVHTLILTNCFRISARGIPSIMASMKKLKHIDLSGCPAVNNVILFYLSKLRYLEYLAVRFCHLITTAGVKHLFQYDVGRTLKSLDLYSCHEVSNDALDIIQCHTSCLQMLNIGGCNKLTVEKIDEIKSLLPNCTIQFECVDEEISNDIIPCSKNEVDYSTCSRMMQNDY